MPVFLEIGADEFKSSEHILPDGRIGGLVDRHCTRGVFGKDETDPAFDSALFDNIFHPIGYEDDLSSVLGGNSKIILKTCHLFHLKDLRYSSMDLAAVFPAPIALITVAAPVTMSPPANTPGMDVCWFSSTKINPLSSVFSPGILRVARDLVPDL